MKKLFWILIVAVAFHFMGCSDTSDTEAAVADCFALTQAYCDLARDCGWIDSSAVPACTQSTFDCDSAIDTTENYGACYTQLLTSPCPSVVGVPQICRGVIVTF